MSALTQPRIAAIEEFAQLRTRAQMDFFHHWITATPGQLESFAARFPALPPARRYLGIREIHVESIVGSVDRSDDFDHHFRPLKHHLRDRWVNMYLLAERGGWPPIRAYKVGDGYFVEDGHHRVSVARAMEMVSIPAEVWEYPVESIAANDPRCTCRYGDLPCAEAPQA